MGERTGAELLVAALKANGAAYFIGIYGVQSLEVLDLLYGDPSLKVITVRHEEAAPFIAYGYAKITGRPAVCYSVPGPGATNMVTSVAAAQADAVPMVILSAQIPLALMDRATNHRCDLEGVFRPVTKEVVTCRKAGDIPGAISRAFRVATEGCPGPAMVIIPSNLFGARADVAVNVPVKPEASPDPGLPARLEEAAAILEKAKAPVIFAGGGVANADAAGELRLLAEKLSAPVFTSEKGRGVIPEDHPLSAGIFLFKGATEVFARADACLALGTKFPEFSTLGWSVPFPERLIEVNRDTAHMGKVYQPEVAIVADVKDVLPRLREMVNQKRADGEIHRLLKQHREQRERETTAFMAREPSFPFHPLWLLRRLREYLPPEAVCVVDNTSSALGAVRDHGFTVSRPRTLLSNDGFGAMGFALPAAIGVKLADPARQALCIVGDGSFLMQMSELATAAACGLSVPVIVMNNGYYGVLQQHQERFCGSRYIGAELNNPDFVKVAEAFGGAGYRVTSPDGLLPALEKAFAFPGPSVVDVPVDVHPVARDLRFRWLTMGLISENDPV
ncbi:MAG: thiamine pyrophosphate-binding protein [Chloroflexota bacterium]